MTERIIKNGETAFMREGEIVAVVPYDIPARAESLADIVFPDFAALIDEILERWFEEHTSLDRREWETLVKPNLREAVMSQLTRKFRAEASKDV